MSQLMQGYLHDGAKNTDVSAWHGGVHPYDPGCDGHPVCKPVGPVPSAKIDDDPVAGVGYDPPPSHYSGNGIMPWDVIDAWKLDYYLGNILKYVCRAGKKDIATRLDDLKKIRNFINKAIELEEKSVG